MSKRARGVGKAIADQPQPFHFTEWYEAAETHHEALIQLAPVLVKADAMATCGLMLSCRAWPWHPP